MPELPDSQRALFIINYFNHLRDKTNKHRTRQFTIFHLISSHFMESVGLVGPSRTHARQPVSLLLIDSIIESFVVSYSIKKLFLEISLNPMPMCKFIDFLFVK